MSTEAITAMRLHNLRPPSDGVLELWDSVSRGLGLRMFPSGRATWCYRYRPQDGSGRKRIRLGDYPTVGLSEARKRADRPRPDLGWCRPSGRSEGEAQRAHIGAGDQAVSR
jgi:hypothetical protein